jgi:hypothetical protein
MDNSQPWRPLLEGDLAEAARASVMDIAAALREPREQSTDPTVASGSAGLAVLYTYLALALEDDEWADVAAAYFDRMVEAVPTAAFQPGLFGGLPGVSWTIEHLRGRLFAAEEDDEDPNVEVDEALLLPLKQRWPGDYDLIRGLVGIGIYARERLPHPLGRQMLLLVEVELADLARRSGDGLVTWHTAPELLPLGQRSVYPQGYHNLGVAHGVPGVIGLLGVAAEAGLLDPEARPLLDGAVAWLLAQELPPGSASRFPSFTGEGIVPAPSRLAWCYGDLGIAVALLIAARGAGEPSWEQEALRIALAAAERRPETTSIVEAGLCHGAAGVGHLFNRLYQATGEKRLATAARFWLARALDLRRPGEGVAGFLAYLPEPGSDTMSWQSDPSFLTGAAGIALALLAADSPLEPAWDRLLMAAIPVTTPAS